jgi:hypothetical protein
VYFETRIMEKLYGRDYAEMLASLNLQDLKEEIKSLTDDGHAQDTKLKLDLAGRNPDDGVTDIAYNKGYFFLRSIEEQYGREKFDAFLRDYFSAHAFRVMDTNTFISYIKNYFQSKYNITLTDTFLNAWILTEGLPETCPQPQANRFKIVDETVAIWNSSQTLDSATTKNWSTHEWLHFLRNLPGDLSQDKLVLLDAAGNFSRSGNAEILTVWLTLSIRYGYAKAYPKLEEFLINTGRRKFLTPLYGELVKTDAGTRMAKTIYSKARPNYHFVATNTLDKMLE